MGKRNFSSSANYKKWLAYGHASGEFEKTPGHQQISIRGKKKKVKHALGGVVTNNPIELEAGELGRQRAIEYVSSSKYKRILKRELKRSKDSDYPSGKKPSFDELYNERLTRVKESKIEDIQNSPWFYEGMGTIGQNLTYKGSEGKLTNRSFINPKGDLSKISLEGVPLKNRTEEFSDVGLEEILHGSHVPLLSGESSLTATSRKLGAKNITPYAEKLLNKKLAKPEDFSFTGDVDKQKLIEYALNPTEVITQIPKLRSETNSLNRRFTLKDAENLINAPSNAGERTFNSLTGKEKPYQEMRRNSKLKRKTKKDLVKIMNNIAMEDVVQNKQIAQYGGKLKFGVGGNITSASRRQERIVDTSSMETQQTAGEVVGGIGSAMSAIPTPVTQAIGPVFSIAGAITSATAEPTITYSPVKNQGQYGFKFGGKMKYNNGGNLKAISDDAVKVQADNPTDTDSVETPTAMLDHNEVVTKDRVYSDSLINPLTNRTFAQDETINQKILGKFQKMKSKSGDTEMKDEKYLNKNSEQLFQKQEKLATQLGLRNEDGSPKQLGDSPAWQGKMKQTLSGKGMFAYGGKMKMQYGGPGVPYKFEEPNYTVAGNPVWFNPNKNITGFDDFEMAAMPGYELLDGKQFKVMPEGTLPSGMNQRPTGELKTISPASIKNRINYFTGENIQAKSTKPIDTIDVTQLPNANTQALLSEKIDQVDSGMGNTSLTNTTGPSDKLTNQSPWGTAGTIVGLASNIFNRITNKPKYVDYRDIGDEERKLQEKAFTRIRVGESQAIQDADTAARTVEDKLQGRSLQSLNAMRRNLATGLGKTKASIRGQYSGKMAQAELSAGQRRTQIESANRAKDMQVDVINTQEADAVRTEAMKMDDNIRKLLVEAQLAQNSNRRNQILTDLMKTQNFKWNQQTGEIEFTNGNISIDPNTAKLKTKIK